MSEGLPPSLPLAGLQTLPEERPPAQVPPLSSGAHRAAPDPRDSCSKLPEQPGPRELAEVTLTLYTHVYNQSQMVKYWIRFNVTPVCRAEQGFACGT